MAITRSTLRLARQLRRDIGTEVDGVARTLTTAWVSAWDRLAPGWEQAASDLVAEAGRLEHWPRPTDIARLPRVIAALDRSEQALAALAERTRTAAIATAEAVVDADLQYEPRIIASQAPAAERAGLLRHLTGRVPVAEQDRDQISLQVQSRIRTDAVNVMRTRAAGQITSDLLPLSDEASESMRRELIRGVDLGSNPGTAAALMVANVEGRFNGGLTRALTISRTEILDAYRGTSQQIHSANSDVVPGWEWLAELDLRTCPSCWAMHGQRFPAQQPGPDDHPQGRCARIPVLASWAELGITAPEPPSVMINAEERFWSLPEAQRLQIMGAGRLRLLADGRISFGDLSTLRQNPGWRTSRVPTSLRDLQRGASRRDPASPAPLAPEPTVRQLIDATDTELVASSRRVYEGTFVGVRTRVTAALRLDSGTVSVRGELRDAAGSKVGDFSRLVMRADDGATVAYHDALEIDPRIQGQGFAQAFNGHLERWYRASGVDRVELYANIDVGGYAWARAGYSFAHHRAAERVLHRLRTRVDFGQLDDQGTLIPAADLAAARELLDRAERLPFGSAGYPMAYEVSQLGRWPGAGRDDMWLGKRALLGANWDAVKPL